MRAMGFDTELVTERLPAFWMVEGLPLVVGWGGSVTSKGGRDKVKESRMASLPRPVST
jgi:hypothetical protein